MKTTRWKIWYSDESSFSSKDGSWFDASPNDVQIITWDDDKGNRENTVGEDSYLPRHLLHEITKYSKELESGKLVKFGKKMDYQKFIKLVKKAMSDNRTPTN